MTNEEREHLDKVAKGLGIGKLAKATLREWASVGNHSQSAQGTPRSAFERE